jgi:hypothetical protein
MHIGYVASTSSNSMFALEPGNVIEFYFGGPTPHAAAKTCAKDHVLATDQNAYVYRVAVESVTGYKASKEVVAFDTSQS